MDDSALLVERLRDDLSDFKKHLRKTYATRTAQVQSVGLRRGAAALAQRWLVDIAGRPTVKAALAEAVYADLTVEFQRFLTFSERATVRGKYDAAIDSILSDYSSNVIVPVKQFAANPHRFSHEPEERPAETFATAFLGQSFLPEDRVVSETVKRALSIIGVSPVTGERPKADRISDKVKRLIDSQPVFVGLFTRRDRIAPKKEWTTSAWVIEEKAYATAKEKKLILLKEEGIQSIGGIQGDYEYIEFSKDSLEKLVFGVLELFEIANAGLRK